MIHTMAPMIQDTMAAHGEPEARNTEPGTSNMDPPKVAVMRRIVASRALIQRWSSTRRPLSIPAAPDGDVGKGDRLFDISDDGCSIWSLLSTLRSSAIVT